ncbi:MAG: response regulator [Chitinophagaceae bacterium]|nr:response regulator [Chitinophagaceae bacterium]
MIKAIIIDDEPLAREIIKEYLQTNNDVEIIAECNDGFEGMKSIQKLQPELIFLDIQMPKINGFEMLELVENPPAVIFTTAFDEYAIRAFDQNAIDYLLKPFSKDRFEQALKKFQQTNSVGPVQNILEEAALSPIQQNRIVVKDGTKIKIIPVTKIYYLESADDYVKIISAEGTFLKNRTMSFYENSLAQFHFIRIHRSYIVNSQLITRIDPFEKDSHTVLLNTGQRLQVSKTGYTKLKEALGF